MQIYIVKIQCCIIFKLHKIIYYNSLRNIKQTLRNINVDNLKRLFKNDSMKKNHEINYFCTYEINSLIPVLTPQILKQAHLMDFKNIKKD